ncbi:YIP1 family protein [Pleionea sediminis]|uniref:YIP1 family protein n=1 Tax=Pleionea sediminis TaxID=2569479 RepID=UPI001186A8A0|nr:YIP1 family protein [Pleionea sediminis]
MFSTLVNIFISPNEAFSDIKQRNTFFVPILLLVSVTVVFWIWYFFSIDANWLINHYINQETSEGSMSIEDQEALSSIITIETLVVLTIIATVGLLFFANLLLATYFTILSSLKTQDISFGKWFSFIYWTSLPTLVLVCNMAVTYSIANEAIAPEALSTIAFSNLLGLEVGHKWHSLTSSLSLVTLWSLALMVLGYRHWTKSSTTTAIIVVVLPFAVFYGAWSTLIMLL